jgi:hypothetical protein
VNLFSVIYTFNLRRKGLMMKTIFVIPLLLLFIFTGCSKDPTEPEPVPGKSNISVTGDLTESYEVTAFFGTSTYTSDTTDKEYFSLLFFPVAEDSNPLAFTLLFKSGPELPSVQVYTMGRYAIGEDIPANHFGGGFSGLNTEDLAGYAITQGTLSFKSVSESIISGELNMSGHWAQFTEEDSSRIVTITGKFNAIPAPEE